MLDDVRCRTAFQERGKPFLLGGLRKKNGMTWQLTEYNSESVLAERVNNVCDSRSKPRSDILRHVRIADRAATLDTIAARFRIEILQVRESIGHGLHDSYGARIIAGSSARLPGADCTQRVGENHGALDEAGSKVRNSDRLLTWQQWQLKQRQNT